MIEKPGAREAIINLLDQNRKKYHITYHGYLSNHLPMALISLYEMGASAERLQEFYDYYVQRLEPSVPSMHFINKTNWKLHLGKNQFYNDYREFFQSERDRLGSAKAAIAEYLPTLIEGVVGGAFHPLLLLGYGAEILDFEQDTVIDGLAFMAVDFRSLGKIDYKPKDQTLTPFQVLKRVYTDHFKHDEYGQLKFPTKIDILLSKEPELLNKFDLLKIDTRESDINTIMSQISETMIGLYSCTFDFFVLHGVTSTYALKILLSFVNPEDKPMIVRYFMRALTAVYVVQNQPKLHFENTKLWQHQIESLNWEKILETAIGGSDEHDIKLVWTCWKEQKERKDELYLLTAAQRLGIVEKPTESNWWPWVTAGVFVSLGVMRIIYLRTHSQ